MAKLKSLPFFSVILKPISYSGNISDLFTDEGCYIRAKDNYLNTMLFLQQTTLLGSP